MLNHRRGMDQSWMDTWNPSQQGMITSGYLFSTQMSQTESGKRADFEVDEVISFQSFLSLPPLSTDTSLSNASFLVFQYKLNVFADYWCFVYGISIADLKLTEREAAMDKLPAGSPFPNSILITGFLFLENRTQVELCMSVVLKRGVLDAKRRLPN